MSLVYAWCMSLAMRCFLARRSCVPHPPSLPVTPVTVIWPQGKGAVVPYLHKVLQKVADGAKAIDQETAANTVGAGAADSDDEEDGGDGNGVTEYGVNGGAGGEAPAEAAGGGEGAAGESVGAGGRRRHRARGVPRASRTGVVTCVDFRKDGLKRYYCLRPLSPSTSICISRTLDTSSCCTVVHVHAPQSCVAIHRPVPSPVLSLLDPRAVTCHQVRLPGAVGAVRQARVLGPALPRHPPRRPGAAPASHGHWYTHTHTPLPLLSFSMLPLHALRWHRQAFRQFTMTPFGLPTHPLASLS